MIARALKKSTRRTARDALNHSRNLLLVLSRAMQSVMQANTADEIYRVVGDEIKSLGGEVTLLTLDDDRQSLTIAYISYAPKLIRQAEKMTGLSARGYRIAFSSDSLHGRIMGGGKTVFVDSTSQAIVEALPEAVRSLAEPLMKILKLQQGILAPLRVDDETLGLLAVSGLFLHEDDVAIVDSFSGQIAAGLRNLRLMQKLQDELAARKQAEEAMRISEEKNYALLDAIPDMIFVLNREGVYLDYHAPDEHLLYVPPESFLGKNIRDVMPPQTAQSYFSILDQAIQSGESQLFEYALDIAGRRMYFEAKIAVYNGNTLIVARDVTGRKQAGKNLSRQFEVLDSLYQMTAIFGQTATVEEVYEAALDSLKNTLAADRASILLFDAEGVMRFKAWRGLSDVYRKAAEGHSPWKPDAQDPQPVLVPDAQTEPSLVSLRSLFSEEGIGALGFVPLTHQGRLLGKFMIYYNDPRVFHAEEIQLAQTIASHIAFAIARKQGEDELRAANRSLEAAHHELQQSLAQEQVLARTDGLTRLYNRRYFFELAEREFNAAIRYQRPLTIILFDIDDFKQINDTFGHLIGDKVLEQVAQATAKQVRDVDVPARYGGDEFIVLLPQTSAQQAFFIAERIRESVASTRIAADNSPFITTLSIGVAEINYAPPDESVEDAVRRADKALYVAKQNGRNHTVIFTEL